MTVTWLDAPNSTLASRSEPVDFIATSDVAVVTVGFGPGRLEEVAYREGAFLYPYLQSTKAGATYSLRRSGGWPRAPEVRVSEASGSPWVILKEFDFASFPTGVQYHPNTTGSGYFTEVADGHVFKIRFAPGTLAYAQFINGLGFQMQTTRSWYGGVSQSGGYLAIDPGQLSGWDPSKPHAVVAYATHAAPSALASIDEFWGVGFFRTVPGAGDGSSAIYPASQVSAGYARMNPTLARPCLLALGVSQDSQTNDGTITAVTQPSTGGNALVLGAVRINSTTGWALWSMWDGTALPALEAMKVTRGTDTASDDVDSLDCGVFVSGSGSGGNASTMIVKKLRILQHI